MKRTFEKVLAEFRQHKVIDGLIVMLLVVCIVITVMTVNMRKSAEVVPTISNATIVSEKTAVSSAAYSSSETSSATVSSSSAPIVSQANSSTPSTKPSTTPSSAAITAIKPTTSTTPAKTNSVPTTVSKPATSTSSNSTNSGLYASLPYGSSQELEHKDFGGGNFELNINAFTLCGYVSTKNVSQYMCDDAYCRVTQQKTGKIITQGYFGEISDDNKLDISTGLDSYQHGSRYWLEPATYTVYVWCQKGEYSENTTFGRPNKVDVCTFSFSVYERGFKS